jgi:biotin carboxylase
MNHTPQFPRHSSIHHANPSRLYTLTNQGWGHASENPKLPEALAAIGIAFIGQQEQQLA